MISVNCTLAAITTAILTLVTAGDHLLAHGDDLARNLVSQVGGLRDVEDLPEGIEQLDQTDLDVGVSYRAEQDGVERPPLVDDAVGDEFPGPEVVLAAVRVVDELEPEAVEFGHRAQDLQALGLDLGSDPVPGQDRHPEWLLLVIHHVDLSEHSRDAVKQGWG